MIENEEQYRISKYWLNRFQQALTELKKSNSGPGSKNIRRITKAALEGQIQTLEEELKEYENKQKIIL